jgi:phenylacetate-CoA ligase
MNCACGRSGPRIRCVGRNDDMLIVLGVNVFPSAVRDVVSQLHPRTTGAMQIVLREPGPKVAPPLQVVAEHSAEAGDLAELERELEQAIRGRLSVSAKVTLVPPETIPRSEMKTALVRVDGSLPERSSE